MVIYRGADGKPGYQQAEDIHDAVTFVEQMRNGEGVEQARIFRLEEVVFDYKPYYRVELAGSTHEAAPVAPLTSTPFPAPSPAAEVPEETTINVDEPYEVVESSPINVDEPVSEVAAGNGARRGLFGTR
jgi:hypothetical protein